ncbi:MAG: phospho-N-acetylmuramoyl-pentapeptide-transferase [bacterium]|nr:phospho-N-acetylmuramoyl-pentapeptide-transferase [bacterium]
MNAFIAIPLLVQVIAAGALAAGIVVLAGPRTIVALAARGQRQRIREDAPARHQLKTGTPTMGGLLLMAAIAAAALLVAGLDRRVLFGIAVMGVFGAVGLLDDLLKTQHNRNLGFRARERLAMQIILGLALGYLAARQSWLGTEIIVPWVGPLDLGWGYVIFAALLYVGFTNAVNLSDGLDGLAAGLVAVAAFGLVVVALTALLSSASVLGAAVAGACVGFLKYNAHPARIIMGDVGSNALGGVLAALAIITKSEIALLFIGGVFVAEAASVMLQVAYFKLTGGRRIFRMSPLHHHFELVGWPEPVIVRRFYLAGWVCLLIGLLVAG